MATSLVITLPLLVLLLLSYATSISGECTLDSDQTIAADELNRRESFKYKLCSIASILIASAVGVSLPLLGRKIPTLSPENDIFFMIKAFAAGVILSTGFVHILPDSFSSLTSPCITGITPIWGDFPFAGFVAMVSSIGTLMVDTLAAGFYRRRHYAKTNVGVIDEEIGGDHASHVHVHTHATHGHAHGSASPSNESSLPMPELIRKRIISQVLELGVLIHSVIIGISLGTSESATSIKSLLLALSFHQFFEGMGLGGCISQAQFKCRSTAIMATCFSLTTPIGIGIGIGISSVYNENSPTALVVEGIVGAASAGILIYMALVDLLAPDFMNPRMQSNVRLQLGAHFSLLLGASSMSLLAKWA